MTLDFGKFFSKGLSPDVAGLDASPSSVLKIGGSG
jgi:hypothetical protein